MDTLDVLDPPLRAFGKVDEGPLLGVCRVASLECFSGCKIFSEEVSIQAVAVRHTYGGGKMQYMMLIYLDENSLTEAQRAQCYEESAAFARELHASGKYHYTAPLQPTSTATSVRVRGGKPLVTDGPFAETREQLGGFFLIEAENRDEAIEIARRIPAGRWGTVEIRPVVEVEGLPHNISN